MIQPIGIVFLIALYAILCVFAALLPLPRRMRRRFQSRTVSAFSGWIAKVLRIEIVETREGHDAREPVFYPRAERAAAARAPGRLLVGNHLSFLDIIILATLRPAIFVTSVEKEEFPFVGFLARSAGCLFVERRHRDRIAHDVEQLRKCLEDGFDIVLFPEGTSGDGEGVLPFKKGLFRAATLAQAQILPFCINYVGLEGKGLTFRDVKRLFFYGEMTLFQHLWNIFTIRRLQVCVTWMKPVETSGRTETRELAQASYKKVSGAYFGILARETAPLL